MKYVVPIIFALAIVASVFGFTDSDPEDGKGAPLTELIAQDALNEQAYYYEQIIEGLMKKCNI